MVAYLIVIQSVEKISIALTFSPLLIAFQIALLTLLNGFATFACCPLDWIAAMVATTTGNYYRLRIHFQ